MTALLEGLKSRSADNQKAQGAPVPDDPALAALVGQVQANELEHQSLAKEEAQIKAQIAEYEGKLNLAPVRQQQLADVLRDYELYSKRVQDLETQLLGAQQTTSVAEHQEGQHFRLVDAPTNPGMPSSPNRLKISLGGLAAGLLLGTGLAFLKETRDTTFHDEATLNQRFKLPLIIGVPLLLTPAEERAQKWRRAFEWVAGFAVMLAMLGAEFFVYQHG